MAGANLSAHRLEMLVKYGQFCPVAKASEVLGERWTLLILRELLSGASSYGDLQRGLGRISPSVLSLRIKALAEHGIVEKFELAAGHGPRYRLTQAGTELAPIVALIAGWGNRWVHSRMTRDELDVELLMLHVQRRFDATAFKQAHGVVGFVFGDLHGPLRRWWLLVDDGEVELCSESPGRVEDVLLTCRLKALAEFFNGDQSLQELLGRAKLVAQGRPALLRSLPRWLRPSAFASEAGSEEALALR